MIHKNKENSFDYRLIANGKVEILLISSFSRGDERWKVLAPLVTTGYEARIIENGEEGRTTYRGQIQLYKVSNGVESKFAVIDTVYVNEKEFKIYVLALENMRMDAQMRFERESKRAIDHFELMPEESKRRIYDMLRGDRRSS